MRRSILFAALVTAVYFVFGRPTPVSAGTVPNVASITIKNGYYGAGTNLDFTLTFSDSVTVTGVPTIALFVGAATDAVEYVSGSGSSNVLFRYTVAPGDLGEGVSLSNNIDLNGGTIQDAALVDADTNIAPSVSFPSVIVDGVPPVVTITGGPSPLITNDSGAVTYLVNISDTNLGLVALQNSNVEVTASGGVTVGNVGVMGVSGTNYSTNFLVTLSDFAGNGSVSITITNGAVTDLAGNASAASADSTAFTVDNTGPILTISPPSVPITNANGKMSFTVTYTDPYLASASLVTGDVGLVTSGTAAGSILSVAPKSSTPTRVTYTVDVGGLSGDGTLGISITPSNAVDTIGNYSLGGSSQAFIVDTTPPVVVVGNLPASLISSKSPVTFSILVTDANLDTNFLSLNPPISLSGGGKPTNITIVPENVTATEEELMVTMSGFKGKSSNAVVVPAGFVADLAGNYSVKTTSSNGFSIDAVLPQVLITGPSVILTNAGSVTYSVSYQSEHPVVSDLLASAITLNTAQTANGAVAVAAAGSNDWVVTVSSISGQGSLSISVAPGTATDSLGNPAAGAGPSGPVLVGNPAFSLSDQASANGLTLSGSGLPNASYEVESATNLINPNWQVVSESTADNSGVFKVTVIGGFFTNPAVPFQFYRAVLQH